MKLSVCIPTYNRAARLEKCLESIAASIRSGMEIEVCVSDNGSEDDTVQVVKRFQDRMPLRFHGNPANRGIPWNFLNVVRMAKGEFVWLLGDDDLLLPEALSRVPEIIDRHSRVDFFCVNSYSVPMANLPDSIESLGAGDLGHRATRYSSLTESREMDFLELVDPRVSFDFLAGMFLSIFRRRNWIEHEDALDPAAVADLRTFAHFDSTFPHVKIFARAFSRSRAYFHAEPLSVCVKGVREWSVLSPFVTSVRLVEALEEYRRNGLPYLRYLRCRNYALRGFLPDLAFMLLHRDRSGWRYVHPLRLLVGNLPYPNLYLSPLYYLAAKARGLARAPA